MDKFLSDLASSNAFWLGLALGGAALLIGWLVAALVRDAPQPPIGGGLFATATLIVLWVEFDVPLAVVLGCAAMVGGVMLGTELWERTLGALPGAAIVIYFGDAASRAAAVVVVLTIAIGGAFATDFDAAFRKSAIGMPLLAGSIVGLLVTVPDTERAFALFGVSLPLIFLGWPRPIVSLGPGVAAAAGIIGWVAGLAGTGRPGATIGAIASLGLMLGEPIGRRLAKRPTALVRLAEAGPVRSLIVVAIHGVLVFGAARIAGLREGALPAIALSLPFIALGALLGAAPDVRHPAAAPSAD